MQDDRTTKRGYKMPHPNNDLRSDVLRLREAMQEIDQDVDDRLTKSGGTMTGPVVLSGDPTQDLHAATKQYVDKPFVAMGEPSGFNLNDPNSIGTFEFSPNGSKVYSLNEDGSVSIRQDSLFATGTPWQQPAQAGRFMIRPRVGQQSFKVWQSGKEISFTEPQIISINQSYSTNTYNGRYHFAYHNEQLVSYLSASLAFRQAHIAAIYGRPDDDRLVMFADLRHGIATDNSIRFSLSETIGSTFYWGMAINGIQVGSITYSGSSSGRFYFIDKQIDIPDLSQHAIMCVDGTLRRVFPESNNIAYKPGAYAQYNRKISSTEYEIVDIPPGKYSVTHFVASNCKLYPVIKIMGREIFTSVEDAVAYLNKTNRQSLVFGLTYLHFVLIGAVVINHLGEVQLMDNGEKFLDLRYTDSSAPFRLVATLPLESKNVLFNQGVSQFGTHNVQSTLDKISTLVFKPWEVRTSGFTASIRSSSWVDTSAGSFTVILPPNPSIGDVVRIADPSGFWAINNLTINRNGKLIMGRSDNLILDVANAIVTFVYVDPSYGWRIL